MYTTGEIGRNVPVPPKRIRKAGTTPAALSRRARISSNSFTSTSQGGSSVTWLGTVRASWSPNAARISRNRDPWGSGTAIATPIVRLVMRGPCGVVRRRSEAGEAKNAVGCSCRRHESGAVGGGGQRLGGDVTRPGGTGGEDAVELALVVEQLASARPGGVDEVGHQVAERDLELPVLLAFELGLDVGDRTIGE